MALGKRKRQQHELFIPTAKLASGPGHPFYTKLNEVLAEAGFDEFVERLCAPYYKEGGRPGIPPGVYFRMVFIGYFEGLDGQRGIAWRCADSFHRYNGEVLIGRCGFLVAAAVGAFVLIGDIGFKRWRFVWLPLVGLAFTYWLYVRAGLFLQMLRQTSA